ncbi:hypothetical protein BGX31_006487 [Mortierella sp. GBA43]|nr:hypothetical protein BGX31_006487 [Mortierella sp. GBA43]
MTDSDFEDAADFDINDMSSILKDIDNTNLALDALDGRADKLRANILSLLQAQSQPNPYDNAETHGLQTNADGAATTNTPSDPKSATSSSASNGSSKESNAP